MVRRPNSDHAGAELGDTLGSVRGVMSGHRLRQADIGLSTLFSSRPLLEGQVRARVRALPGVTLKQGTDIAGLTVSADRRRVTGVQCHGNGQRPAGTPEMIAADLVVDATGRGSRTPLWLREWGYQPPALDRVEIRVSYATRTYRLRPGALGSDKVIVIAATPLDDPVAFRFPASVRHRYERLRHFPAGLLVLGDAFCSFNPVYGQGMTVAANQALVLRRLLACGREVTPREYFRAIARVIDSPWDLAVGADLAFPEVPGARTAKIRLSNAYLPRLPAAAAHDVTLGAAFIRVVGLIEAPETLLRPDRVLRVWWTNRRRLGGLGVTER